MDGFKFCAVSDTYLSSIIGVCKWPTNRIAWTWMDTMPNVPDEALLNCSKRAIASIVRHCNLDMPYVQNASQAQIRQYVRGIDGAGGTLAWSELPCSALPFVMQRYDVSENWYLGEGQAPNGQISLQAVIAHELGHALGLGHLAHGLMSPNYDPIILEPDELMIMELQKRYGPPKAMPDTPSANSPGDRPMDRDKIKQHIGYALQFLEWLASWTYTPVDDNVIIKIKAFTQQDWVIDLIVHFFAREPPQTKEQFYALLDEARKLV